MIKEIKEYIDLLSGVHEDKSEDFNLGWNSALDDLLEHVEKIENINPYFENEDVLIPFKQYPRITITKESFVWIESCISTPLDNEFPPSDYIFPIEQFEQYKKWLKINSLLKF